MKDEVKINSDFIDYYDISAYKDGSIEFNRYTKNRNIKGLEYLKKIGVPVVKVQSASMIDNCDYVVMIKDGSILSKQDAKVLYANQLCTEFYSSRVYKTIHIGERVVVIKENITGCNLDTFEVDDIEDVGVLGNILDTPIYSVEYMKVNGVFRAVRLNEVENLRKNKVETLMKPVEVYKEIKKHLIYRRNIKRF